MKKLTSFLLIFTLSFFNITNVALAATFTTATEAEFNEGSYNNTEFDANRLKLNTGETTGSYTSKIFDSTNASSSWDNISWTQEQCTNNCELPDSQSVETGYNDNANMSNNVALYHLNDAVNSTTFVDSSGNNANGSCTGNLCPTANITGKFNEAVEFHEDNDPDSIRIDNLDSNTFSDGIGSIEMWIAPTLRSYDYLFEHSSSGYFDRVTIIWGIDQGDDYYKIGANLLQGLNTAYGPWDGFNTSTSTWATDGTEWHHIAFVFDKSAIGDNMWLYTDGELKNSTAGNTAYFPEDTGTVWLGNYDDTSGSYAYHGKMDEVAIYGTALSADEIKNHYNRGALNLRLEAKTCDDASCTGETFTDIDQSSPATLTLADNQYFQYQFALSSENTAFSPEIESVNISYTPPGGGGGGVPEFSDYTYALTLIIGMLLIYNYGNFEISYSQSNKTDK